MGKRAVEGRKLVFVEWEDASGPDNTWQYVQDLGEDNPTYLCWSVGWVLEDGKTHLTLTPHCGNIDSPDEEQVAGVVHIPRAMIRRLRVLSLPRR